MFPELIVFFTAMTPFVDLKLAIPLGLKLGLSATTSYLFAVTGNIVPAAIALALLKPITEYARNHSPKINSFLTKIFAKTRESHSKYAEKIKKYGWLFLVFFVAAPIPGSGSFGASIIAFLMGLDYWKALTGITLGIAIAGLVITVGAESVFMLWKHFA